MSPRAHSNVGIFSDPLPLADLGRGALEAAVLVAQGGTPEVDDQRFPGTLYTWDNAEANADMIWGAQAE